jgi:MFS transporter, AAHS family, 4-hydroxybenzoate transporter
MMINVTELLDRNRISWFQMRVFILCAIIALLDGYDTLVIGFTAQPIAASLHVGVGAFGPIFAAVQVGFILGSFVLAPLGDRLGRKPVLIAGVLVFSICSLLVVSIGSLQELLILRFLTGVGIGIANPLFVSLGADYAPSRARGTIVTLFWVGIPLGGVFGGVLGSLLINDLGWRSLYWIGGLAPLPIALLLVFALPESLTFLVMQNKATAKIQKIVRKIAPALSLPPGTGFVTSEAKLPGVPVKHLFTRGEALPTLFLWCAFFADFFVLYASNTWPAALLKAEGVPAATAALITSFYGGGGIVGTLGIGYLLDRFGTIRVLSVAAVIGTLSTASIGFVAHSLVLSCASFLIAGMSIGGFGVGLVVLAAKTYPTAIRSTGVGWGLGVARFSGIVAPLSIGMLVAQGWHMQSILVTCAVPALLAGVFAALLQLSQNRRDLSEEAKAVLPIG